MSRFHRTLSTLGTSQARRGSCMPLAFVLCAVAGCAGDFHLFGSKKTDADAPPPPQGEALVLRGDKLVNEKIAPNEESGRADLAQAHELYRNGEYAKAEKIFRKVADNTKHSATMAEEARYYEAECLRRQAKYPRAGDTYNRMLNDFRNGIYRDQAVQHMFEIANYWLDDTRKEMKQYKEAQGKKQWFVWPGPFVHWEKTKPFLDQEGRAVEKLEQVNLNTVGSNESLAAQSLFMIGSVKFFREDYKEADYFFNQLVEMYPNSPYAPKALELCIISKHMSTGGPDYDGRKCAEARELIQVAKRNYREFADEKTSFMDRQIAGITMQQAAKDFKIADFYRRTGHPGAAYFYYEIVRRRYPNTPYYDQATERMHELKQKVDKKARKQGKEPEPEQAPELAPAPKKLPSVPRSGPGSEQAPPPPRVLPPLGRAPVPAPGALPPPTSSGPAPAVPSPDQLPPAPPGRPGPTGNP